MAKSKKDKDQQRAFKGIWIPAEVWVSAEITMQEKLFLVEIDSLDNEDGCYASNQYFSDFFGISKVRVSEVISSLIFKGFLVSNIDKSEGNERTIRVVKTRMQALKDSFKTLENKSLRGSQTNLKEGIKETFTSKSNPSSNPSSNPVKESKSVVTDTPPLSQTSESKTNSSEKTEKPINLDSVNSEKSTDKKPNSGGGGEKNVDKSVSLDIDKDIAPKGLTPDKVDFIFLEASRITTPEIIAKFALWHERRATKTKGVRSCKHYQKIMSKIANSDLELHEIIQGLDMAYESTWTGLEIDWIKNKTRTKQTQQNGTSKLEQQKQHIADSPFFKGL